MKRFFTFLLLSIFVLGNQLYSQEPLPKGLTEEEKKDYIEFINNPPAPKNAMQPTAPPRTPGEWEEAEGVIVSWAAFSPELREIVREAREVAKVYIICDDCSTVQNYLTNGGVSMTNIEMLQPPFNSVWVRDYGPQSVYLDNGDLAIIDWLYNRPHRPDDNNIPNYMANHLGAPFYQLSGSSGMLVATGGNFMSDGHGSGFSSKLILTENPSYTEAQIDQIKYDYMGIDRYIKMDELPYDIISHLDMHMKLLDEETLLVAQFPSGVSDGPYIEANLQYVLNNYNTAFDRDYQVVRIPMVPSSSGQYPPNSHYRTFTNSLILNELVLVPQYGHHLDETGLQIYRDAMPGYNVVGVNMENVIAYAGAIHCITREIAATDPIHISHARRRIALVEEDEIDFKAVVNSPSGIESVYLMWTDDIENGFEAVEMTFENGEYYAHLEGEELEEGMMIHYYLEATNNNSKTIAKPLVAPEGYYSFEVKLIDDTSIDENKIHPTFALYPNPATSIITFSASPKFAGGSLSITNMQGKTVFETEIDRNDYDILMSIDVNNLPGGIYVVKAIKDNLIEVKKFVKQ